MENPQNRVATFRNWSMLPGPSTLILAANGFFFTGSEDEVECFSCGVKIRNWKASDSVSERHAQLSSHCELLKDVAYNHSIQNRSVLQNDDQLEEDGSQPNVGDIVQNTRINETPALLTTMDDTSDGNVEVLGRTRERNFSRIDNNRPHTDAPPLIIRSNSDVFRVMSESSENDENWFSTRRISGGQSVTIDYTSDINRLASFNGRWSDTAPVSVLELVSAGLYFTGPEDRVQCAYCRGGLYNWSPGDTAIGEHVRHFPKCTFAKEKLNELLGKHKPVSTERKSEVTATRGTENEQWISAPAVKIAEGMGYPLRIIKKAAKKVWSCSCDEPLSSDTLMEAIFEIESTRDEELGETLNESENEDIVPEQGAVGGESGPSDTKKETLSWTKNPESNPTDKNEENVSNRESLPVNHDLGEEDMKALLEENTRLRGNTMCKVCLDASVDTLFLPCRHLVCCEDCANEVKSCPLCRTLILGTVKTFLS